MVSHIPHTLELRNPLKQRTLNTLTQGHVRLAAALATATKVTKRSLPHHSVPRLGSACPHSGTAPRAAATGHPWPGAAKSASLPIYPLHRAYLRPSWLTGPADQNQKQIKSRAQRPPGRLECKKKKQRPERKQICFSVGAGLLAKNLRAPRLSRMPASSLTTFASKPAPTFGPCPL